MVWSTKPERRSFTKIRGSKRLAADAEDRRGSRRDGDDLPGGPADARRDDLAAVAAAARLLVDARGG